MGPVLDIFNPQLSATKKAKQKMFQKRIVFKGLMAAIMLYLLN